MDIEELTPALAESLLIANRIMGEVIDILLEGKITLQSIQDLGAIVESTRILHKMMIDAYVSDGLAADDLLNHIQTVLKEHPNV